MTAYMIARIDVTDAEKWKGYAALSGPAAAKYGGEFIVRGGAMEGLENHEDEGKRVVIVKFPSCEAARTWYNSPEYTEARAAREGAGFGRFMIVEGYDG